VDPVAIAEYLAETPLFACLSPSDRVELAGHMRTKHFAKGEVVFHRDDPASHLYVIVAGTVKVSVPDESGREVVFALERGGDVFGELALFDEGTRSATVTALNETQVLTLSRQDFMTTLERNHEAMRKMLALLARTVRRSTSRVEDLVFLDLTGRVAKCLIDLAELSGANRIELTQDDLASYVGATRVSVNRVLADLERRGTIALGRGHIEVRDLAALRREIQY
jgi:CRP-like cAMP-binding protein